MYNKTSSSITCKCPMCSNFHKTNLGDRGIIIHWIGNGIPRVYCSNCIKVVRTLEDWERNNERSRI